MSTFASELRSRASAFVAPTLLALVARDESQEQQLQGLEGTGLNPPLPASESHTNVIIIPWFAIVKVIIGLLQTEQVQRFGSGRCNDGAGRAAANSRNFASRRSRRKYGSSEARTLCDEDRGCSLTNITSQACQYLLHIHVHPSPLLDYAPTARSPKSCSQTYHRAASSSA
ncbi:hypothetical protein C8F01DRAFT_500721 [Mycena amicta]|nr:hypothetical protein C8F01DRAFT_500721 [Mycena amicta]